jgi:acyl-CoA reductase-like NAD-dependent aldehyde dehydrogenase
MPPAELRPTAAERVFFKQFFSGFGSPGLAEALRAQRVDTLIVAGLYTHGCVRATALDAYERGFQVILAQDALASTDPLHAEITRAYLAERAATFLRSEEILRWLTKHGRQPCDADDSLPLAYIDGDWRRDRGSRVRTHFDPTQRDRPLAAVPLAGAEVVAQAVEAARRGHALWSRGDPATRRAFLNRWRETIQRDTESSARLIAGEIGKPLADASEEILRALAHIAAAAHAGLDEAISPGVHVSHRSLGCIGLVTPWNNPIAIPAAKIAAALAYGDAVVWKPSPLAPRTAAYLMDSLSGAGLPPGAVNLVFGDGETARHLITHPGVAAISFTGSIPAGRTVSALCACARKPLQAELGGNNAVVVLRDADLAAEIPALVRAAFGFAGQRCTAVRRFIVERAVIEPFLDRFVAAARALRIGDPLDENTELGPLVSPDRVDAVTRVIERAVAEGARLLAGGGAPEALRHGCWLEPAVLSHVDPGSQVSLEETFGPVAIVLPADGLEEAIDLVNAVPHGLVAGLSTRDPAVRKRFAQLVETGIVNLASGPLAVHPDAPFGGWKASGIGPPEHGRWDREFYSRPQTIYGDTDQP